MNKITELSQKGKDLKYRVASLAWDESKHSRGKTTPGSRGGSFAPSGGGGLTNLPHGKSPGQLGIEAARREARGEGGNKNVVSPSSDGLGVSKDWHGLLSDDPVKFMKTRTKESLRKIIRNTRSSLEQGSSRGSSRDRDIVFLRAAQEELRSRK